MILAVQFGIPCQDKREEVMSIIPSSNFDEIRRRFLPLVDSETILSQKTFHSDSSKKSPARSLAL